MENEAGCGDPLRILVGRRVIHRTEAMHTIHTSKQQSDKLTRGKLNPSLSVLTVTAKKGTEQNNVDTQ